MKFKFVCFTLVTTLIIGCNRNLTSSNLDERDSLKVMSGNFEVEGKAALLSEYYLDFGIAIPKFYIVKDSIPIDLNSDKIIDTLVVFSPVLLEDPKYSGYRSESSPNRLLVEVLNNGTKSRIRSVHTNVISNTGGVLSKYGGITLTDSGFAITHQSGSRYSWTVTSEFLVGKDSIVLTKFKKTCSLEGLEESAEYVFDNKSAGAFNINDSIQDNCNCDRMWKTLEKRLEND